MAESDDLEALAQTLERSAKLVNDENARMDDLVRPDTDTTAAEGLERALNRARMVLRDGQGSTRRHGFCNADLHHLVEAASGRAPTPPGGGEEPGEFARLDLDPTKSVGGTARPFMPTELSMPPYEYQKPDHGSFVAPFQPPAPSPGAVTQAADFDVVRDALDAYFTEYHCGSSDSPDFVHISGGCTPQSAGTKINLLALTDAVVYRLQSAREGWGGCAECGPVYGGCEHEASSPRPGEEERLREAGLAVVEAHDEWAAATGFGAPDDPLSDQIERLRVALRPATQDEGGSDHGR